MKDKKNKASTIVFILTEILLFAFLIMFFVVPLLNIKIDFDRFIDEATKNKADSIVQTIKEKSLLKLANDIMDYSLEIESELKQLNKFFSQNALIDARLVNLSVLKPTGSDSSSFTVIHLTYSATLEEGYGILIIGLNKANDNINIRSIQINMLDKSLEELADFYGQPMNAKRVLLFLCIIFVMVFLMYTEYDYYKLVSKNNILLQLLIPLLSIMAFSIKWSSLTFSQFIIMRIGLFPISNMHTGLVGEWIVSLHIPIIAILYWVIFRKKEAQKEKEQIDAMSNCTTVTDGESENQLAEDITTHESCITPAVEQLERDVIDGK